MTKIKVRTRKSKKDETEKTDVEKASEQKVESIPQIADSGNDNDHGNDFRESTSNETPKQTETDLNDLSSLMSQFETDVPLLETEDADEPEKGKRKRRTKKEMSGNAEQPTFIIPPQLAIRVVDGMGIAATGWLDKLLSDNPLPANVLNAMRATDQQVEDLKPAAVAMLKELKADEHPTVVFFASMTANWMTNYMMVRQLFDDKNKQENNGNV